MIIVTNKPRGGFENEAVFLAFCTSAANSMLHIF